MKPLFLMFGLAVAATHVHSQNDDAARERSRQAIDAAMERARVQAKQEQLARPADKPRGMQYEDLRKMQGVDPAELANQYREISKSAKPAGPDLMVFVSTSMPIPTLTRLATQMKAAGGVMVFRGVKGGLSKKAFSEWLGQLKPVAETGASIQIDPESFQRYSVNAVPTFVIAASRGEECGGTSCAAQASSISGDVSLDYALEKFSSRGGEIGRVADSYLSKITNR